MQLSVMHDAKILCQNRGSEAQNAQAAEHADRRALVYAIYQQDSQYISESQQSAEKYNPYFPLNE